MDMKACFNPFNSRFCRIIRNELSESLMKAIHSCDIGPSYAVGEKYMSEGVEPYITGYINSRIMRYKTVVNQIRTANIQLHETYIIALLLWDQELFFEVHEWLEKKWRSSKGAEKIISQALIRAAGTYMHLEYERNLSAKKMASKAVETLIRHKESVPEFLNAELLIAKLKALDPVPPKFGLPKHTPKQDCP
jgi:uncharacterized protein